MNKTHIFLSVAITIMGFIGALVGGMYAASAFMAACKPPLNLPF